MNYSDSKGKVLSFETAQEAQQYAKKNVGTTVVRASDGNGYVAKESRLKTKNNSSYISEILTNNPEIPILAISEVASAIGKEEIVNSEVSDAIAEEVLIETLSPISKTGLGLFGIGLIFGLPF